MEAKTREKPIDIAKDAIAKKCESNLERWNEIKKWALEFCDCETPKQLNAAGQRLANDQTASDRVKTALRHVYAYLMKALHKELEGRF